MKYLKVLEKGLKILKKNIPKIVLGIFLMIQSSLVFASENNISTPIKIEQKNSSKVKIQELKKNINSIPKTIKLVLEDRIFSLNFQTHPELLQKKPQHFLRLPHQKIPLDLDSQLLKTPHIFSVETEFLTEISEENLNNYLDTTNIFGYKPDKPIMLTQNKKGWIKIDGFPTQGYFEVDKPKLIKLINFALKTENTFVRVPAFKTYPKVIADKKIQDQGIKEVIAIGRSNFAGSSAARRQNILAAIRKYNGMVLKKGKIFSFNSILKSVERKDGFVEELVIKGGENKKEMGGGVCQVSTTVFRAAFMGGLPIVNRRNHSYAVPYYKPHGIDATIYLGGQDFRFRNDTDGDILIQGFTSGANLYFVFYGTNDGRKVNLEGPFVSSYRKAPAPEIIETDELPEGVMKTVSHAHDGFYTRWTRKIKFKDGTESKEDLESVYRAWAAQILKGKKKKEIPADKKITENLNPIRTPDYSS